MQQFILLLYHAPGNISLAYCLEFKANLYKIVQLAIMYIIAYNFGNNF